MRRRHRLYAEPVVQPADLMRYDIINELLCATRQRRYLEIGVQAGKCGARVNATEKWGVDPTPMVGADGRYHHFYQGPSNTFFDSISPEQRFDVIFVDGLHHADQVLRDTLNALDHLADDGFVVLHDCNPLTEAAQVVPRQTGVWNGDCWKAMVRLRERADLDAFTVATDHGVGIVRKRVNPTPLQRVLSPLTYELLERHREELLGLVSPENWTERVGAPVALGRVVLVSANIGDRDEPAPAPELDVDDCVMFTDGDAPSGWRAMPAPAGADPRLAARRVKTLALELVDADVVVWVDGRIRLTGLPIRRLLRRTLAGHEMCGFPHPWRDTVLCEAIECARLDLAPAVALDAQVAAYKAAGFADDRGLWNTMVLVRRNTERLRAFGRAWWSEIQEHTVRDQVSFPYLLWRHGLTCGQLGTDVYRPGSNDYFIRGAHRGQPT